MTQVLRSRDVVDRTFTSRRSAARLESCLSGADWASDLQRAMALRRIAVVHGKAAWAAMRQGRHRDVLANLAVAWVATVGLNGCCRGEPS